MYVIQTKYRQFRVYISLKNRLLKLNDTPLIICGDWNLFLDYSVDIYGYITQKSEQKVTSMINNLELIDAWGTNNPDNIKIYMG